MPVNCPAPFDGSCEGCPKRSIDDTCLWYHPPIPLSEILTPHERIDMLQVELDKAKRQAPSYVLADIRKDLNQVQGMLLHFQKQFNEHLAPQKRKKLEKPTNEGEEGVVEV